MRWAAGAAVALLIGCGLLRGPIGAAGLALAFGGATLNLWAWWAIVGLAGRAAKEGGTPRLGSSLVVLAFLVKLPVFVGLFALARHLGNSAVGPFIFGTILVYFSVTTWAATRAQAF